MEIPDGIETDNSKANEVEVVNAINPMLLSPVIKCVYKYLNVKYMKNCRLVSREWNLNSKLILRNRAKIVFTNDQEEIPNLAISEFLEDFRKPQNLPFHAFAIRNYCKTSIDFKARLSQLNELFESQQNNLKELELDYTFVIEDKNPLYNHDITPWISTSLMTKPNTKYNTKLHVQCYHRTERLGVILSTSLSSLLFIKNILLTDFSININNVNGLKMSPVKLMLDQVVFTNGSNSRGAIKLNEICLNDYMDFSKCQDIRLQPRGRATKIRLDLYGDKGRVNLEKLALLQDVKVVNWGYSSWKVNQFQLHRVPLLERCGMEINKLYFSYADIDLFCLPPSIQMLSLTQLNDETISCSQPLSLPNLKHLLIKFCNSPILSVLSHFNNSHKINIHLQRIIIQDTYDVALMGFDWFPKSIRRLKISDMGIDWKDLGDGDGLICIDQLVFENFCYSSVKSFFKANVQVQDVVIYFSCVRSFDSINDKEFSDLLKYLNENCKQQPQRIFAGPFKSDKKTPLSVDKIAQYYVFENQIGRAITRRNFYEFESLYNPD